MLKHSTIGEKVHTILREDILTGKYKPGERLFFKKIAEEHEVSMTPIKEAFLRLEREGLVTIKTRKGTCVREFSKKNIIEYYQIRLALEDLAVELICEKGLSKDSENLLLKSCDRMTEHIKENNLSKCIADDITFHTLLVKASGNHLLFELISTLPLTNLFNFTKHSDVYVKKAGFYLEQHHKIITLLKEKKVSGAKKLLRRHIYIADSVINNAKDSSQENFK